jgi:hypothetical protein
MRSTLSFTVIASAALRAALAQESSSGSIWATPHESYSSSVGVLGCKINTNRVAYWPASIDCENICVKVTYEGRSVNLLRIDQSEGAFDISYDAWNYLYTGSSAAEKPTTGGPVPMDYKFVDANECADLIHTDNGKLPLSASNSMNYVASCLAQPNSWVAKNYELYNVLDPICAWGCDEKCTLDWPTANQADCPSGLGTPTILSDAPVYNIQYGSGKTVLASSGEVVNVAAVSSGSSVNFASGGVKLTIPGGSSGASEDTSAPEPEPETPAAASSEAAAAPVETPAATGAGTAPSPTGFATVPASASAAPSGSASPSGSGSGSSPSTPSSSSTPETVQSAGRRQLTIPFSLLLPILTLAWLG